MTPASEGRWALIVHGGAKAIEPGEEEANRRGVLQALAAGRAVLEGGGAAVDAVEAAIRVMEDLPVFNAGRGSALNEAGGVEMCAGLMDGRDLSVGAVGAIRNVRHPIAVAKRLLGEKEILLVGEGATLFAKENGAEMVAGEALVTEARKAALEAMHDTVGAVAMDRGGNLAAGTSTGGLAGAKVGRIGDSPLPGNGLYADNHVGGVSFSGDGETIARLALAARVMAGMAEQGPEAAIRDAVERLPGTGGAGADGGAIAIDRTGRIGWAHNSPAFAVAYANEGGGEPRACLGKDEEARD
ncbi:MAG: isoaspartyl peptidase/L-asparaginase [Alphaproteobacteria bacterium]|nr:isoaspartyl peptidase/L-asparaginase [Alphaproteobacteria bacterium]MBV9372907.1 isoaspartyl peptidase/L-asparaginase [Alphaproteobacteria bacterium]MBV9902095.1 isoaspartyl peptidase/L-asparaginase [Alphaproteobacteria bacterium]